MTKLLAWPLAIAAVRPDVIVSKKIYVTVLPLPVQLPSAG